jgi:acetoacetyl-CoA synthetase
VTVPPVWRPTAARIDAARITQLVRRAGCGDTAELHRWSVDRPADFWDLVWDDAAVVGERGDGPALDHTGRWFPYASLSYAENLLAHAPAPDAPAVIDADESGRRRTTSWSELVASVGAAAAALRADGVGPGDRVAAWLPNVSETVVVALAASAVGAVFTSTSTDFGADAVVERFGQVEPVVLVATDRARYAGTVHPLLDRVADVADRLPSLRRVVVVANEPLAPMPDRFAGWAEWLAAHAGAAVDPVRLPFDHPGFILYSSGTTGPPKCIVHRAAGVLLMHLKEHQYHCDVRPGDRLCYFTTCGWMMWNWQLTALASGATIVCYDGSPFHPGPTALFDLVDELGLTLLGVSAKFIDSCRKTPGLDPASSHRLDTLRTVCSTGSPLHADGFEWVHAHVRADIHLASISGGTDLCGCFVAGDPTRPVWAGEIQGAALGMDVDVVDDDGVPCRPGVEGELVCRPTFPTVPLGFWGDDDGSRFRRAYFDRFDGWWTHGDRAEWTGDGDARRGIVIHGRSDATLNAGGVRIGTAELYRVVDALDEVAESVAVTQAWDDDARIVLFVRPASGHRVDERLVTAIRTALRRSCSPRHVPACIVEVSDVPRTRSNKVSELAVADAVNGRPVRNLDALANPESLDQFRDRPEFGSR